MSALPKWQIKGTLQGKPKAVCVQASEWSAARRAVRISHPTMIVSSIVMVDDRREHTRALAVKAWKVMRGVA